jgi:hypothetical protein
VSGCAYPSENHSADTVTVHHGCPERVVLCGSHASWSLSRVMDAVRAAGAHDCRANFAKLASTTLGAITE